MKSAARATIIAAVGLSLLALCPRAAFSQSKMAPENISSGVSKPPLAASGKSSNKKDNTIHLYSGDTLRLSSIAAPGAKKMRLVSITANNSRAVGKGNHSMVVSTSGGPGSYKGQLQYVLGKQSFHVPVQVSFIPKEPAVAYHFPCVAKIGKDFVPKEAPSDPAPRKANATAHKYSRIHLRDFFGYPPLEDTRAYGGAICYLDQYGILNLGLSVDSRVKRLSSHCALRLSLTAAIGTKNIRIGGVSGASSSRFDGGSITTSYATALGSETYVSFGLEQGSGHIAGLFSLMLGINHAVGSGAETTYHITSAGHDKPSVLDFDLNRWKSFIGIMASLSMNFDIAKLTLFSDVKWAIKAEGYPVPDPYARQIIDCGVMVKLPVDGVFHSQKPRY